MATFTNKATLHYNGSVTDSNTATGEIVLPLAIEKTAVGGDYTPGGDVTFAVSFVNSGDEDYNGLVLTDDLGTYCFGLQRLTPLDYDEDSLLYFVNGELTDAPEVESGPPLLINGINVPAGGNALLIYRASVNGYAPPDGEGSITNTATITGARLSVPLSAEAVITARDNVNLAVSKAICPATVTDNERVTYTLTVLNSGNSPVLAEDGAFLTDTFDPILSDIAVLFNGEQWSEPVNYSYNEATGEFVTSDGQLVIPAATYTRDPISGLWTVVPGVGVITVSGILQA